MDHEKKYPHYSKLFKKDLYNSKEKWWLSIYSICSRCHKTSLNNSNQNFVTKSSRVQIPKQFDMVKKIIKNLSSVLKFTQIDTFIKMYPDNS